MSATPQQAPIAQKLILIVDDTPTNIGVISGALRDSYKTKIASNGQKALALASAEDKPDLILLDVMMPEMDGYEVCSRLKADPATREIPHVDRERFNLRRGQDLQKLGPSLHNEVGGFSVVCLEKLFQLGEWLSHGGGVSSSRMGSCGFCRKRGANGSDRGSEHPREFFESSRRGLVRTDVGFYHGGGLCEGGGP